MRQTKGASKFEQSQQHGADDHPAHARQPLPLRRRGGALTDGNKIYNTITDQNGRASFNVETPPFYTSQIVSPAAQPFTQVTLLISSPGYVSIRVVNLMVFR